MVVHFPSNYKNNLFLDDPKNFEQNSFQKRENIIFAINWSKILNLVT